MGKCIGIVLAGGIGSRFGRGKPKQYFPILGKEMIAYSIELFRAAKTIDDFVVVLNREEFENGRIARQYGVKVIPGGATRNHSFKAALDWIEANHPDCEKIIENNAACPLTRPEWIDEMLDLLDDFDWVQTALHLTDALGSKSNRFVDRDDYFLIQAPDAYRFREILACFNPDHPCGHPAVQLPAVAKGQNIFRDGEVFKVTHPSDVEIAELILRRRMKEK